MSVSKEAGCVRISLRHPTSESWSLPDAPLCVLCHSLQAGFQCTVSSKQGTAPIHVLLFVLSVDPQLCLSTLSPLAIKILSAVGPRPTQWPGTESVLTASSFMHGMC